MAASLAGKLLVATPSLVDPNFARTVVLICEHNAEGALGVVLNRPMEHATIGEHLPAWAPFVSTPPVIFQGGPVEPATALALGELTGAGARADKVGVGRRPPRLSRSADSACQKSLRARA